MAASRLVVPAVDAGRDLDVIECAIDRQRRHQFRRERQQAAVTQYPVAFGQQAGVLEVVMEPNLALGRGLASDEVVELAIEAGEIFLGDRTGNHDVAVAAEGPQLIITQHRLIVNAAIGSVGVELRRERLGSSHPVRLDEAEFDVIPVDVVGVQPDPEPSFGTGVTRQKVVHGIGVDLGFVDARGSLAGDRDAAIAMVVVEVPSEPLLADRSTEMLIAFASGLGLNLWQCVEDLPDPRSGVGHVDHCSTGHYLLSRVVKGNADATRPA
ncbi:MAG: hypothetical protein R2707_07075 [Acidimicrobiales bacterium]